MIEIDFKLTYFISPAAYINDYLSRSDEYFKAGDEIKLYVDSDKIDYASIGSQMKLNLLNKHIKECTGCQQKWVVPNTFKSWYVSFKDYSLKMKDSTVLDTDGNT